LKKKIECSGVDNQRISKLEKGVLKGRMKRKPAGRERITTTLAMSMTSEESEEKRSGGARPDASKLKKAIER